MYTLGYRVQAVDGGEGDRRRPLDPRLHPRDRARARHRPAHPLRPPRRARRVVERRRALDRRRRAHRHRRDVRAHLRLPVRVHRLLPLRRGLHAGASRASSASRAQVVHPQHWPEDLDYAGKRVVVIGSGATAVTLVPAMASDAAHVTMLQRSPTYVVVAARRGPDRQLAAPRPAATAPPTSSRAGRTSRSPALVLPAQPPLPEARCKRLIRARRPAPAAAPATTSTRTSSRATTRGTSACASSPTATCSRRSAAARASVVTDRDRDVHRDAASALASGDDLEADIVVTATGPEPAGVRRHRAHRRRRAGRAARTLATRA